MMTELLDWTTILLAWLLAEFLLTVVIIVVMWRIERFTESQSDESAGPPHE